MENPTDCKYTKDHEWIKVDGDTATVGITDFAQHVLTDVVFVELPEVGSAVEQGKPAGSIESVKSVADLFAPVSGEVTAVNEALASNPELVNTDAFGEGWMFKFKMSKPEELDSLMDAAAYTEHADKEEH